MPRNSTGNGNSGRGNLSDQQQVRLLEKLVAIMEQQQQARGGVSSSVSAPWRAEAGTGLMPARTARPGPRLRGMDFRRGLSLTGGGRMLRGAGAGLSRGAAALTTAGGALGGAAGAAATIGIEGAKFAAATGRIFADDTISTGEKNLRFRKFLGSQIAGRFGEDIVDMLAYYSGDMLRKRVDDATLGGVRRFISTQNALGIDVGQEDLRKVGLAYQNTELRKELQTREFIQKTFEKDFLVNKSASEFNNTLIEVGKRLTGFGEVIDRITNKANNAEDGR